MKLKQLIESILLRERIVARFGTARLVREARGRFQLLGGTFEDRLAAREWASFPPSAVAIGANGSGDMLVFLVENDERFGDAVYIWEHETGQIRQVASSVEVLTDRGMDEPRPNKPLKKLSDFG